jgi:hypothetical protein
MDPRSPEGKNERDAKYWAAKVDRLHVADDLRAFGYNIEGRRIAGPMNGFGRMWQRIYTADLGEAATPERVVADWRAHFGDYWPRMGRFHGTVSAIKPGDVAPLTAGVVTTGIMVLYADDTSFTFLTPEGHMFAALITFSCEVSESGGTISQIRILLRSSDPIFEAMWPLIRRGEDIFWPRTLKNLAAAHGVHNVAVKVHTQCVDRRRLWKNWSNVRYNAGIRTITHTVTTPLRLRTGKTET